MANKSTDLPILTGAQALIASLERCGVEVAFGIPGGAILPAYDPLYDSSIRHILVRHEQGAGHAAEGYAMATGRVGVCIATSGPGATNLVTPIADAYLDSVPIVAITGQVNSTFIGTDAFQEADIRGITMPITKHNFLVKRTEDIPVSQGRLPYRVHRASRASAGRRGQDALTGRARSTLRTNWCCPATSRLPSPTVARSRSPHGSSACRSARCCTSVAASSRPAPGRSSPTSSNSPGSRWSRP